MFETRRHHLLKRKQFQGKMLRKILHQASFPRRFLLLIMVITYVRGFKALMRMGIINNGLATTGTNVSILFLDATNTGDVVLIDASNLGTKVKEGKNQKTLLSDTEEQQIIDVFNSKEAKDDFSIVASYEDIKAKNYSLSAGQYFEVKIEYVDITQEEFTTKMKGFEMNLERLFGESKNLEKEIKGNLKSLSI